MTHLAIPNRAVLSLDGPDTIALLERTVTNTVQDWTNGEIRYGALLTPQGKLIADYLATRTETGVLIDLHEDALDDLAKRLKMFRLRADVQIERAEDTYVAAGEDGTPDPRSAALPKRIITADKPANSASDYHAQRIAAGIPEWGSDYRAAEVFPTDINMDVMNGIDYKKGCFVGQEVASRMKRKGTLRKRTLRIEGTALEVGADITAATSIGTATSISGTHGLALIRLDRLATQTLADNGLTCNGQTATVITDTDDWAAQEIGKFTPDA